MIYLVCAIYPEAKGYIDHLKLKRMDGFTSYQVYANEEVTLFITGSGKVNSAIAITDFFAQNKVLANDSIILVGCAGGLKNTNSLFIANKIVDGDTGFTYYPDILFKHPFEEATFITCSHVVNASNVSRYDSYRDTTTLFEMEASALYQAAIRFFTCDKIIVIKFVSDNVLTGEIINPLESYSVEAIIKFVQALASASSSEEDDDTSLLTQKLAELFSASETMANDIAKLVSYLDTLDIESNEFVDSFLKEVNIVEPVIRKTGKEMLEKFRKAVLDLDL